MQYARIELQIAQVERIIKHSRKKFSNKSKEKIYSNIIALFTKIQNCNYQSFSARDSFHTKIALDIIFYSIEFLNYKSEKEIPKRLIFCLNKVLDEWILNGTNEYFIVISYNNTPDNFFIRGYDQGNLNAIQLIIKSLFSVDYTQSLIQISKPKFLSNDYLSSIPLYHEVGHFIDGNYQITYSLSREPDFALFGISEIHFSEYFADLFAAQYIGKSAIAPLDENLNFISDSHPINSDRVDVVNTFINGTGSLKTMSIVSELKRITLLRTNTELKIRYTDLSERENPFNSLSPQIIEDPTKLHSLFLAAWTNWLDPNSKIRLKYSDHKRCSKEINSLVRSSIKLSMQKYESNRYKRMGNYLQNLAIRCSLIKDS